MTAVVRQATEADVTSIAEVCTKAYQVAYADILPEGFIDRMIAVYYTEERTAREIPPSEPAWLGYQVAEEDGRIVGVTGGGMKDPTTGEVFVLYLEPGQRGRGLGTLLLDAVTDRLREAGAKEQWVSVFLGNQKGIAFYRARGFRPVETVQAYGSRTDDHVRSLRMHRVLD
ncbi:GNAT family N-acetyltransferase [Actinoplanes sp. NPDC051851]|uniref:GNAT family N-acetyltransferase n=1 Tax=Actinoplanes sp. NPDC051851 TaxID=3154753 RepID=UPI00343C787D